ncbi:MAG: Ribonuclease VapC, partial [Candidatus Rokubacteria bacterium]|nr:Ribonuclease VapC [Candidatus Rokubacteria bacterium]
MIHLDTSVLVVALSGPKSVAGTLRQVIEQGERIALSAIVLYEWLRGPRLREELTAQEALFPTESSVPFGPEAATLAAELYRALRRSRSRELDLAIAACALVHGAALWTLNPRDVDDVPDLAL